MVHDGLKMADDIRNLCAEGRVDGGGECGLELSGERDVCKSDVLCCRVRAGNKVLLQDGGSGSQAVLEHGVDRFVVRIIAPLTSWRTRAS